MLRVAGFWNTDGNNFVSSFGFQVSSFKFQVFGTRMVEIEEIFEILIFENSQ